MSLNPGSLLATKMVKEGFDMVGKDLRTGADILVKAALSDEFAAASGRYFDNDTGRFASPPPDALDLQKCQEAVQVIESMLANIASVQRLTSTTTRPRTFPSSRSWATSMASLSAISRVISSSCAKFRSEHRRCQAATRSL